MLRGCFDYIVDLEFLRACGGVEGFGSALRWRELYAGTLDLD